MQVLSSAPDADQLFAKIFSENPNIDDSGNVVHVVTSRSNRNLQNIYVTPDMVKNVIIDLVFVLVSTPNCTLVIVLKNCDPELLKILADLC